METGEWQTACGNAGIGDGAVDVDENFPIIIIDIVDACSSTYIYDVLQINQLSQRAKIHPLDN